MTVTSTTAPAWGTVTVVRNGSFVYIANPNYNGPDSFRYAASDPLGGSASGFVNITVGGCSR